MFRSRYNCNGEFDNKEPLACRDPLGGRSQQTGSLRLNPAMEHRTWLVPAIQLPTQDKHKILHF